MPWVKYPFHVRHDGVDYAPGEEIEVESAAGHILRGATEVVRPVEDPEKPQPKRKTNAPARSK
ncbi:MAG: hypothetical protein II266_01735 [Clostridia bacterium]|nr:hypothetical protein [Clostridia bacterium]